MAIQVDTREVAFDSELPVASGNGVNWSPEDSVAKTLASFERDPSQPPLSEVDRLRDAHSDCRTLGIKEIETIISSSRGESNVQRCSIDDLYARRRGELLNDLGWTEADVESARTTWTASYRAIVG